MDLLWKSSRLMVFHGLLRKGRPLEAYHDKKRFQWEARKTVDLSKNFSFHFARYISNIFFALSETYEMLSENA